MFSMNLSMQASGVQSCIRREPIGREGPCRTFERFIRYALGVACRGPGKGEK